MKKLIALCTLTVLAACSTGPKMIPTDGPVRNQVERVVVRHDAYVNVDTALPGDLQSQYLDESALSLALVTGSDQVTAAALAPSFNPVMDRHDAYVRADGGLSILEKETYLASTRDLRALLTDLQ